MIRWPGPSVVLDVYARLPEEISGSRLEKRPNPRLAQFPWFIEGPVVDESGNLYVADLAWGRVIRITPGGTVSVVVDYEGQPNGLALNSDGTLLVADRIQGLLCLRPADGHLETLATGVGNTPFLGLNDLVVGVDGTIYVTDQGDSGLQRAEGRLLRFRHGTAKTLLGNVPSPNGLALNSQETTLHLAVTRDNAIWRVPLDADGDLVAPVGRYIQLSGGVGPDGVANGPGESLLVAHLGMGVVWVFDRRGGPILALRSPVGDYTTNVTFAPDRRRVFVTESVSGCVLTTDLALHLGVGEPG